MDMESAPKDSPEKPSLMSEEEGEKVFKLMDQMSRPQALARVLGDVRAKAVIASEQRDEFSQISEEAREHNEGRAQAIEDSQNKKALEAVKDTQPAETESGDDAGDSTQTN